MYATNSHFSQEIKTGIILFSRTRNSEARSKKWHASHAKNLVIAEHLIERTKGILGATGHDVIHIDETKQRGSTFGEKIRAAFEDQFQLGYVNLILVGNDTVGLTEKTISRAIQYLDQNDCVFGSTVDNGLYLIGFERSFFEVKPDEIEALPWKTSRLVEEFTTLAEFDRAAFLPVLSDLNSVEDIKKLLKNTWDAFSEILRSILHGTASRADGLYFSVLLDFPFTQLKKRGPPILFLK